MTRDRRTGHEAGRPPPRSGSREDFGAAVEGLAARARVPCPELHVGHWLVMPLGGGGPSQKVASPPAPDIIAWWLDPSFRPSGRRQEASMVLARWRGNLLTLACPSRRENRWVQGAWLEPAG